MQSPLMAETHQKIFQLCQIIQGNYTKSYEKIFFRVKIILENLLKREETKISYQVSRFTD